MKLCGFAVPQWGLLDGLLPTNKLARIVRAILAD
jgi:hypothetical protein